MFEKTRCRVRRVTFKKGRTPRDEPWCSSMEFTETQGGFFLEKRGPLTYHRFLISARDPILDHIAALDEGA